MYESWKPSMTKTGKKRLLSWKLSDCGNCTKKCRRKRTGVDTCGKQNRLSTLNTAKKQGKIGYTQSYPHYPQKTPRKFAIYITQKANGCSVKNG